MKKPTVLLGTITAYQGAAGRLLWQQEFDRRDREFQRNNEGDDEYDDCDQDREYHRDWDDHDHEDAL